MAGSIPPTKTRKLPDGYATQETFDYQMLQAIGCREFKYRISTSYALLKQLDGILKQVVGPECVSFIRTNTYALNRPLTWFSVWGGDAVKFQTYLTDVESVTAVILALGQQNVNVEDLTTIRDDTEESP